jgi:hypothetical protein
MVLFKYQPPCEALYTIFVGDKDLTCNMLIKVFTNIDSQLSGEVSGVVFFNPTRSNNNK